MEGRIRHIPLTGIENRPFIVPIVRELEAIGTFDAWLLPDAVEGERWYSGDAVQRALTLPATPRDTLQEHRQALARVVGARR